MRNIKTFRQLIRNEIAWCEGRRGESGKGEEFERGFMEGLKQALHLVNAAHEAEREGVDIGKL